MPEKNIAFSPPDITQLEIDEVVDTLKSGWITTGPKTARFEEEIALYCNVEKAVCLNSATAGLELVLRLLGIGPGDEVITTPYSYAATANVILHTGAKPVFADIKKGEFNIDPAALGKAVTKRTKAVMPVDVGGYPCDYDEIKSVLEENSKKYSPKKNTLQVNFGKPVILADCAHSFGASYKNVKAGGLADFSVFSFHAVKNLTTAEGGAVAFSGFRGLDAGECYKRLKLLSLHGQDKDALSKVKAGNWKYAIEVPGYKCNMTDIQAAIGLAQLKRYDADIMPKRRKIFEIYCELLASDKILLPPFNAEDRFHSHHLFPVRIKDADETCRDRIISVMTDKRIALNVHYIPIVMHPAYTSLGYRIKDFPNAYKMYENEISLPVYSKLSWDDACTVSMELIKTIDKI